jgi:methionyl-tRNA synthetase
MLLGAGHIDPADRATPLNLPTDVVANEFVNIEGQAMSTSRNWAVWIPDYLERYDPDPLRYALTINAPESRDVDFTWDDFVRRNNEELLATWGNLVNRVLTMAYTRFEARVPVPGPLNAEDAAILERAGSAFGVVGREIEARRFKTGLLEAMAVAHDVNRYLNEKAPWKAIKEDAEAAGTTLYVALQAIHDLTTVLAPFLPHTSERAHRLLGFDGPLFGTTAIETVGEGTDRHDVLRYRAGAATGRWASTPLPPGQALPEPVALVTKLDPAVAEHERERLVLAAAEGP